MMHFNKLKNSAVCEILKVAPQLATILKCCTHINASDQ